MLATPETWARTICLAIALANQIMLTMGWYPVELDESLIYNLISVVCTIITAVIAWWKNNSFTPEALAGDRLKDDLKCKSTSEQHR